jgi:peptidyl-prolyl cis-trans isomerase B (cyclophilin B)
MASVRRTRGSRTWLWITLTIAAVVFIAAGGGVLYLYASSSPAAQTGSGLGRRSSASAPPPGRQSLVLIPRVTGPNGGPLAGPSHPGRPSGTTCRYTQADPGSGDARVVDPPLSTATVSGHVTVTIKTGLGVLTLQLLADRAPCAVNSFVHLAQQDYYTDTECHRLTTDSLWVLQCGDPSGTGTGSPGYQFGEENLPTFDPPYPRGTVAMSNAGPGTSGGQFFLVYKNSDIPPDYSVVGTVVSGMDLLDRIGAAGTDNGSTDGHPKLAVHIDEVTVG